MPLPDNCLEMNGNHFSPDDPNTWKNNHEYRIYGDDRASVWAVVDEIDYHYFVNWLWSPKWSKGHTKVYLRRNVQTGTKKDGRIQQTLFLHVAIMKRTGIQPPSPLHVIVDHRDSDSMNCKRSNLRWATHSMNCKNRNGQYAYDLIEG